MFIDETWTKTNMAPRGQRIKAKVPHGALLGLGDFLLKIIIFGRLSVAFHNAMPAIPSTTKTAPATINQCGYSIAESMGHFPFAFSPAGAFSAIRGDDDDDDASASSVWRNHLSSRG
ncbi:MAG: hypothetical protein QOD93_2875 [Acetobacteraceae bacterium]|nr:hypothetical protein [Acetobacteraceae bacterium]